MMKWKKCQLRRAARAMLAACGLSLGGVTGGCGGGPAVPAIKDGAYDGPALSLETMDRRHMVVMEAPTPGWTMTLDRTMQARDHEQAFVTVTRPKPGMMYAQVIVKQNLLTPVESRHPIRVYARQLEFAQEAEGDYRLAGASAGRGPEPTAPAKPRPAPSKAPDPSKAAEPAKTPGAEPAAPESEAPDPPKAPGPAEPAPK